ncbi:MAG TPA: hypothetical protein VMF52_01875 [Steroidobacteraceae bacterium]|nr:hypothetical protein [Steroidobacteraceae bacterium]
MYSKIEGMKRFGMRGLAAALLFMGATVASAQEPTTDSLIKEWLGKEFTVESSTVNDRMPQGGKLTFVFDTEDDVVRICTRSVDAQKGKWSADFANSCAVKMTFTRGTRFCSFEDVKTGNAEVLSQCHRLRSRDVAMRPAKVKGTVELNDMMAFLIEGADGMHYMSILVDSPSRVTEDGSVVVGCCRH